MTLTRLPNGFSFIEMIMTVSVFILLTIGGTISYREFNRNQQVIQSAKNTQQLLREAQKKARVGEKPSGCESIRGYEVRGRTNSSTVELYAMCQEGTNIIQLLVNTVELSGNAGLSSDLTVRYKVLTGGASWSGNVTVQVPKYPAQATHRYQFEIDSGGSISEGAPL